VSGDVRITNRRIHKFVLNLYLIKFVEMVKLLFQDWCFGKGTWEEAPGDRVLPLNVSRQPGEGGGNMRCRDRTNYILNRETRRD